MEKIKYFDCQKLAHQMHVPDVILKKIKRGKKRDDENGTNSSTNF